MLREVGYSSASQYSWRSCLARRYIGERLMLSEQSSTPQGEPCDLCRETVQANSSKDGLKERTRRYNGLAKDPAGRARGVAPGRCASDRNKHSS